MILPENLEMLMEKYLNETFTPKKHALTKLRNTFRNSTRTFFENDEWFEVDAIDPISDAAGACEDWSTLFRIDYFGKPGFLIQTGQQHLENYVYEEFDKVFTINSSQRNEKELNSRRLSSFKLIEAEAANFNLADIQNVIERLVYKLCADLVVHRERELALLGANVTKLVDIRLPFERITYTDAVGILRKDFSIDWGEDLRAEHEKSLGQQIGQPFFVTHYPRAIKFFNMKTDPTQSEVALSCDLLVPGYGEVAGSAEREDDFAILLEKLEIFTRDDKRRQDIATLGFDPDNLAREYYWYLALRKFRQVPHAGFGIGVERLIQWICDFPNIVSTTEFPMVASRSAV